MSKRTSELRASDGSRIAFHVHGERGPMLVLSNGIGTTENFWRFLIDDLGHDHRLVHWDYRGHGSSSLSMSNDYGMRTHAEDLALVTKAVMSPGDPPPVQVGFSMGVAVVLELYRAHPELVRALGLIAGAPDAPGVDTLFARKGSLPRARRVATRMLPVVPVFAPGVRALLRSGWLYPVAVKLGILQRTAGKDDITQFFNGIASMDLTAYVRSAIALFEADANDVLPSVTVPVAIVAAAKDLLMPLSQIQRMRDALPQASWTIVEDAGHAGLLEQGPRIAREVRGLMSRLPA